MWQKVKELLFRFRKVIIGVAAAALVLFVLGTSWFTVGPGSIGIKYNTLTGASSIYQSGLHFKLSLVEKVTRLDGRVQKATYEEESFSKDMQQVNIKVSVNYHLDTQKAGKVFADIGGNYEDVIVTPAVRNEIKTSIAKYNISAVMENRDIIKKTIEDSLSVILSSSNIVLNAVNIENIKFNPKLQKAVEDKEIQAQQYRGGEFQGQ
jgi:regulator of protease activity HflC (stomatin/prohibitin superfamily)